MAIGAPGVGGDGEPERALDETYFFLGAPGESEGCRFVVEIQEDPAESGGGGQGGGEAIQFAPNPNGESSWRGNGEDGARSGGEGCSCLFGNPCIDQYVCKDWSNRFEVSKKNGFKG